jgi:hypothetical protein
MDSPRPTSRWRPSAVTFGPVGRIVATIVVLLPILYAVFVSVFFLIAAAIWGLTIVPWALRDIWRRVPAGPPPPAPIVPTPQTRPLEPGTSIADRHPPARW